MRACAAFFTCLWGCGGEEGCGYFGVVKFIFCDLESILRLYLFKD